MIYKEYISIQAIALHYVGNKLNQDGITFSDSLVSFDTEMKDVLMMYFLSPFKGLDFYNLTHETSLELNEVYSYVSTIFSNPDSILEQSENLAKHLYESSRHPKIKKGEFYTVYFKDCIVDGQTTDAIGIFKSENKDTFLKIYPSNSGYELASERGININRLDKGCIIFNLEKTDGYLVTALDNINRGNDAKFWMDDFLHLKPRIDSHYKTQIALSMCKQFVTNEFLNNPKYDKSKEISILNNTEEFFKEQQTFNIDKYVNSVIKDENLMTAFKNFKNTYEDNYNLDISESFEVDSRIIKKHNKIFRVIVKLDDNFDIHIHKNSELIEKGIDANGRKYYKLYYKVDE